MDIWWGFGIKIHTYLDLDWVWIVNSGFNMDSRKPDSWYYSIQKEFARKLSKDEKRDLDLC